MTFMISIGQYGGFYWIGGRICLGWVAFTYLPFDIDLFLSPLVRHWEHRKARS